MAFTMWKGLATDEMDEWRQMEKLLPKYAASASKALRWATKGEETGYRGEQVLEFDPHDPEQLVEILGAAAGAQPRRLAAKREESWAKKEAAQFYIARRTLLMRQFWEAFDAKDREARADVMTAIREYNREVPFREMGISANELMQSVKNRVKSQRKAEVGLPDSMRYRRLYEDTAESFSSSADKAP